MFRFIKRFGCSLRAQRSFDIVHDFVSTHSSKEISEMLVQYGVILNDFRRSRDFQRFYDFGDFDDTYNNVHKVLERSADMYNEQRNLAIFMDDQIGYQKYRIQDPDVQKVISNDLYFRSFQYVAYHLIISFSHLKETSQDSTFLLNQLMTLTRDFVNLSNSHNLLDESAREYLNFSTKKSLAMLEFKKAALKFSSLEFYSENVESIEVNLANQRQSVIEINQLEFDYLHNKIVKAAKTLPVISLTQHKEPNIYLDKRDLIPDHVSNEILEFLDKNFSLEFFEMDVAIKSKTEFRLESLGNLIGAIQGFFIGYAKPEISLLIGALNNFYDFETTIRLFDIYKNCSNNPNFQKAAHNAIGLVIKEKGWDEKTLTTNLNTLYDK